MNTPQQSSSFDGLVNNAIDFFKQALDHQELQNRPKYSLINFACGVELILKARLMHEHWTLILEDPDKANLIDFNNGDFKSVSTLKAIERISNTANENLSHSHFGDIKNLLNHRNKLVHFFEPSYLNETDPKHKARVELVIKEQCRSWYKLNHIINNNWASIFQNFKSEFGVINNLIKTNAKYLQARFEEVQPELKDLEDEGYLVIDCLSCGYKAFNTNIINDDVPLYDKGECKVCDDMTWVVIFKCTKCQSSNVYSGNREFIVCDCGETTDALDLIGEDFANETAHFVDKNQADSIFCSECVEETVVSEGDGYLCLLCLSEFGHLVECEWCSEKYATDNESYLQDSFFDGCEKCDGRLGWR